MTNPTFFTLRRVRILQYVLFGAFMACYAAVLQADRFIAWGLLLSQGKWLVSPWMLGGVGALVGILFAHGTLRVLNVFQLSIHRQLLCLAAVFFAIGMLTDSNETQTLERRTARLCAQGRYEEALRTGEHYSAASANLVALRAFALTRMQTAPHSSPLAQRFFHYPLPPGASAHQLELDTAAATIAPFYAHMLAASPPVKKTVEEDRKLHLRLVGLLIDRRLVAFAHALPQSYRATIDCETLPTAYREALVLYRRKTAQPLFAYADASTEANYLDFTELRKKLRSQPPLNTHYDVKAEANLLRSNYGRTYWFYFFYSPEFISTP